MLPPETESQALDLIASMETWYQAAFTEYADNEAIYDGAFETMVALPAGYPVTIPSTSRAIVDEAVANIIPDDIEVHYPPRGVTTRAEEDADLVRRFCRGLYRHWRRSSSDIDALSDWAKNIIISGVGAAKLVPDYTLWPVLPEGEIEELRETGKLKERVAAIKDLRERHCPLTIRSMAPRCFMVDPTVSARKLWFVERYSSSAAEIRSIYARFEEDFRGYTSVTANHLVHELWTADYMAWDGKPVGGKHFVFIDRIMAHKGENPYRDVPFVTKYSGFGRQSYEGKPQLKTVGLYTPQVKSLIKAEARRFSQFDAIMAQAAFPIGVFPNSVDLAAFDTTPGALNSVPDNVFENMSKIWLVPPIPDGEYLNSLGVLGAQIERGSTGPALRGAPVRGTDSAAQLAMSTGQAQLRIESARTSLEDGLAELFSKALWYIENIFKGKLSVFVAEKDSHRYTLGPENIKGHYDVAVTFKPNEEQIKERKLALASDAIVKGGLSPYDALVFAGFENPSEIIARRLAYDVMQEPLVRRAMAKEMLEEWGVDADALAMEEQMDQGLMQKTLSAFMNALQSGSLRGVGDPMTASGSPPGGGAQDPMAALAQGGQGPMPMDIGNQPMDPALASGAAMQQGF